MSLNLDERCKQRMKELVAETIPEVKVRNRIIIPRSTIMLLRAEGALPKSGEARRHLEQYIGEMPFIEFAISVLSESLEKQAADSADDHESLVQIKGYHDPKAVANTLVNEFESLPWTYMLTIDLGNDLGELFAKTVKLFAISDTAPLITPDDEFGKVFPLKTGIETVDYKLGYGPLNLFSIPKWNHASAYLQIESKGFIGRFSETQPFEEAVSLIKSFCGVAIALKLLRVKDSFNPVSRKTKVFVHRYVDGMWGIEYVRELHTSLSDTLHDLALHDLDGELHSENDKARWMQMKLEDISYLFCNSERAGKILLASQWLLDSYCGKNELLSFVQTVVVMEILLGEKAMSDLLGLGELLGNRCAYLIGESHKQREEVLADFQGIYRLRSNIVHRGKAKLSLNERVLFDKTTMDVSPSHSRRSQIAKTGPYRG